MIGTATSKPAKGSKKREKACAKARQRRSDWFVYQAVDLRDGLRCRICLEYAGLGIHRHHLVYRSAGGLTTTGNILSLCPTCHLVGIHGGRLKASGDADERATDGRLCGVRVEQLNTGDVWHT